MSDTVMFILDRRSVEYGRTCNIPNNFNLKQNNVRLKGKLTWIVLNKQEVDIVLIQLFPQTRIGLHEIQIYFYKMCSKICKSSSYNITNQVCVKQNLISIYFYFYVTLYYTSLLTFMYFCFQDKSNTRRHCFPIYKERFKRCKISFQWSLNVCLNSPFLHWL